jgi:hypothetical protein
MSREFLKVTKGYNAPYEYIKDITDELFVGAQRVWDESPFNYEILLRRKVVSELVPEPKYTDAVGYIITAQMAKTYDEAVEISDEMARRVAAGIVLGETLSDMFVKVFK